MIHKKIDFLYIIFFLTGCFIFLSFTYTNYINDTSKDNFQTIEKIEKLSSINQDMDAFLVKKLKYENLDYISQDIKDFDKYFFELKNKDLNRINLKFIKNTLDDIELKYSEKIEIIEDFKSNSGLFITSVHYLLNLNNILQKRYYFSPILTKTQTLSLFFTKSIFEGADIYKVDNLLKELEGLTESNKLSDIVIKDFINHVTFAKENYISLTNLIEENNKLKLQKEIDRLKRFIINHFEHSNRNLKIIQYLLFSTDAIFLVMLIILYRQKKDQQKELIQFKNAVENSDNSIIITDLNRVITYVNDAFCKTSGYKKTEAIGNTPSLIKSNKKDKEFYETLNARLLNEKRWEGEFINRKKDGTLYYEASSIVPIKDEDEVTGYLAINLDITDYIEQKNELLLKTERLNEAQVIAHMGYWEYNIRTNSASLSNEVKLIMGIKDKNETTHLVNLTKIVHPQDRTQAYKNYKNFIFYGLRSNFEFRIVLPDGTIKHVLSRHKLKQDKDGKLSILTGTLQDITEIVEAREKINFMAYHDHLTGLDNRISFEDKLDHAITLAKRNNNNIFIFFIDLDRFKNINDTLGHPIGDKLLKIIAKRLNNIVREADTLARLGGDEFALLVETTNNLTNISHIANKILESVKEPAKFDNYTLDVSASIGISIYPENGKDTQTLLKNADNAMYLAKERGKNNFQFYTEILSQETKKRMAIEQALKNALGKELYLVYQPQYNLKTQEIVGLEALIRWENSVLGFISPALFIPIAEECGYISDIGNWVLKKACEDFKALQNLKLSPDKISINVSSVQFKDENIVSKFEEIVKNSGITPEFVELELTERYMMESTEGNLSILKELRQSGFNISVDDFGTGYSSMSYLKQLPLDTLKVDKSFIDEVPGDENGVAVTKAIITLAQSLKYNIIAEGIETKEQENFLKEYTGMIGQGYLFSKPLKFNDLVSFLKTSNTKNSQT